MRHAGARHSDRVRGTATPSARSLRARTLAGLALAAILTAVSGCVSVPRQPPGPAPATVHRMAPPPPEQMVTEPPPREALESTGPAAAPATRPSRTEAPPRRGRPGRATPPAPARPAKPRRQQPTPRVTAPAVPRVPLRAPLPVTVPVPTPVAITVPVPDVCALSEQYGAWHPDSHESRACRAAAGH